MYVLLPKFYISQLSAREAEIVDITYTHTFICYRKFHPTVETGQASTKSIEQEVNKGRSYLGWKSIDMG